MILALLLTASACALTLPAHAFAQGVGNPIVPPPVPAPNITVENRIVVEAPAPDPELIANASVQSSEAILTTIVLPPLVQWTNDLLSLPDIWRSTPASLTYENAAIRSLAETVRNAALALVALAIFAVGAGHALRQDVSFGRLLFAVFLAVGNLTFWEIGIRLNNAICESLGAPSLPELIRPHLQTGLDPTSGVGTVLITILYAAIALLLVFSLLFRLGLVDILIAGGSLALLCYATPQSEGLARHYSSVAVGTLFGQVLIVLGLRVASVLTGLGGGGTLGALLGIAVLLLVRELPRMLIAGGGAGQRQGHGFSYALVLMLRRRIGL